MKKLLIILLFLPLLVDAQWSHDKINMSFVDHAGACALITLGTFVVSDWIFPESKYTRTIAFSVAMGIGLIKEFYEAQPDEIDLIADWTGCWIGVGLTLTVDGYHRKRKR